MNPATFCLAAPLFVMAQPSRKLASIASLAVNLFASYDILFTGEFLRAAGNPLPPSSLWLAAAILQTLPWALLWAGPSVPFRLSLAVLVSAIPPFGLIGWNSALHGAGMLFPGFGILGIFCTLALLEIALASRTAMIGVIILAFAIPAYTATTSLPPPPADWCAVRTNHGDIFNHPSPIELVESVGEIASESSANVVVFPESMIPRWTDATPLFLPGDLLRRKAVVVGSTLPRGRGYRNVAVAVGQHSFVLDQRIPVPVAMWRPWADDGAPLNLWTSPIRSVGGRKAAFLICYEQLLPWSYLTLLFRRVDLLVGISNVYWVRGTRIPKVQSRCLESWARLLRCSILGGCQSVG